MPDGDELNYASRLTKVTEGEWAGWSFYPGGDPFEDLAGPFYWRADPDGARRCAFKAEARHMNGGGFMHGGCIMTFADYCLFVIGAQALADSHAVTATFNGEFISTARPGDRVEGSGEVIKAGRSMVFLRGVVMNATTAKPMMSFSAVLKKVNLRT